MNPFDTCPVCGGGVVEKEVEKLLKGGMHTAVIEVRAEVMPALRGALVCA
jgi:hypothetical protein